ncbi:30S ribosomal protein S8 [Corallibacter vietnamensis]|uniref:Small ribosomal subunit protein uS8 n=3 Tax=Flavobacteriaceae TaxID=49546 RepID=A0ABP7GWA6_9FLAO
MLKKPAGKKLNIYKLVSGLASIVKNRYRKLITMYTDPIADYLTRIRNAVRANHRVVEIPASNLKKEITKILFDQGYILSYKFEDNTVQGTIKIALKYNKETKESVIKKIQRISKPGLRKYASSKDLPRILNGLGIAIVSTSHGVMTGKQAQRENVGGEVLCYVY